jgi:hypothetical protein
VSAAGGRIDPSACAALGVISWHPAADTPPRRPGGRGPARPAPAPRPRPPQAPPAPRRRRPPRSPRPSRGPGRLGSLVDARGLSRRGCGCDSAAAGPRAESRCASSKTPVTHTACGRVYAAAGAPPRTAPQLDEAREPHRNLAAAVDRLACRDLRAPNRFSSRERSLD